MRFGFGSAHFSLLIVAGREIDTFLPNDSAQAAPRILSEPARWSVQAESTIPGGGRSRSAAFRIMPSSCADSSSPRLTPQRNLDY